MFAWQTEPSYPLVVAANRDERFDRPATAICVLEDRAPRILGGRDELAGGTWLAVNERGVVAGLTNRPSPGGRDLTKRSRGEIPLMAAGQRSAQKGVSEVVRRVEPGRYNPAWLLVGDRASLFYVELGAEQPPEVRPLPPGVHVLENVPLGDRSPKVDRVRRLLSRGGSPDEPLWTRLPAALADHAVPAAVPPERVGAPAAPRPPATLASCVHTADYGTRSAALIRVPADAERCPDVRVADGPSCTSPLVDVGRLWAPRAPDRP